jgi:hypothetical protein
MNTLPDMAAATRKVGAEDIIMMRLPSDRFRNCIPSHYEPPVDDKSRYQVALLTQSCERNSFDNDETGRTDDLHFWLRVASSNPGPHVKGADIMLPSMHWLALASATSNADAGRYLESFGFNPLNLEKIDLQGHGGSLAFPDGSRIVWTIAGPGKGLPRVGVRHVIFVAADGPDAAGHRITALVSDTVMEQPGKVYIQTAALEPFLFEGERLPAAVHRMPKLEAGVVWGRHPK